MLLVMVQSTLTTVYYGRPITVLVYYIVYYGICNYGITALCNMVMVQIVHTIIWHASRVPQCKR